MVTTLKMQEMLKMREMRNENARHDNGGKDNAGKAVCRAVFGEQLQISGCWFHYAQAAIRRMKKTGTSRGIQDAGTDTVGVSVCSLLSLPLLPSNDIEPGFGDVQWMDIDDSASKQLIAMLTGSG